MRGGDDTVVRGGRGDRRLMSREALDQLKYEVAEDLGLAGEVATRGWADMKTRDIGVIGGHIGGNMVRVMIRYAQEAMTRGDRLG